MFTAMLRQCGYRNCIPIMVHNKPLQLNTKQEDWVSFDNFKLNENIKKEIFQKDIIKSDMFKFLDIPNGTYIH
jgi:hypothetical protein